MSHARLLGNIGDQPTTTGYVLRGNTSNFKSETILKTTSTTVSKTLENFEYCAVTSNNYIELTLPSTPQSGWQVGVGIGNFRSNTMILRNGTNIMGIAENLLFDFANCSITMVYVDSTVGWKIY